jgi:hypothetical protein
MSRQIPLPALGQYSVAQLQAPRVPVPQTNNLLELAKGLNVVSDIVTTYDQIKQTQDRQRQALEKARALKGKEREAYEQALITEGATQFDLDPGGVSRQMEAYEREVRKLTEEGKMPEQANALFMLGAKQAKGKVLANNVYREMLFNPQTISETIDPVQTVQEKRQELFSRPEFQSELVKQAALENIQKVEQEFIKDVNARFDEIDIEDAKTNWLLNGKPLIQQSINGELDINDPSIKNWVNDKVGLFKGSRKYAWDNLIKEDLKEGLSTGDLTPSEVKTFLNDLRKLDLGGGVKFADAETGNAITDFIDYVDNKAAVYESKANAKINEEYELAMSSSIQVFLNEWSEDGSISEDTFKNEANRLASLVPPSKTKTYLLDLRKQFSNLNQAKDDATNITYSNRILELEQGKDLDELKNQLLKDVTQGAITQPQFAELNSKLESYRDFNNNFIKTDTYKTLSDGYEEVILGFRIQAGWDPSKIQNHFERIGAIEGEAVYEEDNHLYGRIKKLKGESAAKIYLNNRYTVFKKEFKESLKNKFDGYLEDGKSVAEARNLLINEAVQVGTNIFEKWSQDSITLATQLYGI